MEPLKIFYSYSHKDKTFRQELGKHLSSFRHNGVCQDWYDGDIGAGDFWDDQIKEKLRAADFILLLISANFLASNYIRSVELEEAMRRHQAAEARVIPIMLRSCVFEGEMFSKLQGLPSEMKPVDLWASQDEAWTDVVKGLAVQFHKFRNAPLASHETAPATRQAPDGHSGAPPTAWLGETAVAPGQRLNIAQEKNRELAATSTKAFHGLSELMEKPNVKTFVEEQQQKLLSAGKALQVLVDYKNVHDRLHDLQFKCYNYIFQEGRKLEDEIDWPLLVQPQKDLEGILQSLRVAAEQPSMADENFEWLQSLQKAQERLNAACDTLTIAPLQEAGKMIRTILEMRPTIFDTKLCAAARTLPLHDLRKALSAIQSKLGAGLIASDAGTRFSAGVDALPELSDNLQTLTTEHTRWQVIASTLWSIDALIDQNIDVLANSWPKLRERLEKICGNNPARWAVSILEAAAKLDQLLSLPPPDNTVEFQRWQKKVRMVYTSCSNDGGTRFYQVDLSLKRLCDELQDVQLALAKVLEELP